MIHQWWWKQSERTRLGFLTGVQIVFVAIFVAILCRAIIEAVKSDPDIVTLNLLVLAFVSQLAIAGFVLSRKKRLPWYWREFADLRHEFTGAFILTSLLLFLVTIPGDRKLENQLKRQLVREMGSRDSGIALRAVRELEGRGWLDGNLLTGADLMGANLEEVDLIGRNLQEADLHRANLTSAKLAWANLQGSFLRQTNLQNAFLADSNLQGADLVAADLQGANLARADLQGVNFLSANLQGADLTEALFNADTLLPNDRFWTPFTDMARFTDDAHPDFWRPDHRYGSPAYWSDIE